MFILEHFLGLSLFEKKFGESRRKLYSEINEQLKGVNRGGLQDINDIDGQMSLDEFKKHPYTPNMPHVFRKAAIDWPCVKKWSLEFFAENYGGMEVILTDNVGFIDPDNPQEFDTLELREYIKALKGGSLKYLKFSSIVHKDKNLQKDLDLKWLKRFHLPTSFGPRFFLFIGGKNTRTPIHNAIPGTVFVQITGKKKWTIYPTEEQVFLHVRAERRSYFYSDIIPNNLNDPKFHLSKYAKKYEVILEPGDVLWIPPFVWHEVENLTDSIGVAYKFANIPAALKSTKLLTSLFFLATKPNLISAYWSSLSKDEDHLFERSQAALE